MSTFKITFAGGTRSPTGSNFLIEMGGKKILIDCGLKQGEKISLEENKKDFIFDPKTIDAMFVTHGHLDHVGRIPKLVKDGFSGTIYSTAPTREIAELILLDSMGVLGKEASRDNTAPLYEERDVLKSMQLWKEANYHEKIDIRTSNGLATFELFDSGHILGSAIVVISYDGKKIAFTGDLGNTPSPLMKDTEEIKGLDYLIMESVYGDRNHEDYESRVDLLKEAIVSTTQRNGVLLIPAFSIERTQEMLFYFNEMVEKKIIPQVPVYLDSPLGINITKVYKKYEKQFNENTEKIIKSGDDIFAFKGLVMTPSAEESKKINEVNPPKVIIAGSGMSNGGRILHHEARYLSDPKNTLLIVGFQAPGTLGRRLVEKEKQVQINGDTIQVNAKVVSIRGFSAHKDSDHLVKFAGSSKETLKKVIVVLGEPKSSLFLAQRLKEEYGYDTYVPEEGETIEI